MKVRAKDGATEAEVFLAMIVQNAKGTAVSCCAIGAQWLAPDTKWHPSPLNMVWGSDGCDIGGGEGYAVGAAFRDVMTDGEG